MLAIALWTLPAGAFGDDGGMAIPEPEGGALAAPSEGVPAAPEPPAEPGPPAVPPADIGPYGPNHLEPAEEPGSASRPVATVSPAATGYAPADTAEQDAWPRVQTHAAPVPESSMHGLVGAFAPGAETRALGDGPSLWPLVALLSGVLAVLIALGWAVSTRVSRTRAQGLHRFA